MAETDAETDRNVASLHPTVTLEYELDSSEVTEEKKCAFYAKGEGDDEFSPRHARRVSEPPFPAAPIDKISTESDDALAETFYEILNAYKESVGKKQGKVVQSDVQDKKLTVVDLAQETFPSIQDDSPPRPLEAIHLYAGSSIAKAAYEATHIKEERSYRSKCKRKNRKAEVAINSKLVYQPEEANASANDLQNYENESRMGFKIFSDSRFLPPAVPVSSSFTAENPCVALEYLSRYSSGRENNSSNMLPPAEFSCLVASETVQVMEQANSSMRLREHLEENASSTRFKSILQPIFENAGVSEEVLESELSHLLLSWYFSGFYTGRHSAFAEMLSKSDNETTDDCDKKVL